MLRSDVVCRVSTALAVAVMVGACGSDVELADDVAVPTPDVDYCAVETAGTHVEIVRPDLNGGEAAIDDVNWFARPVPTESGAWVIAFASHNQNYLYDLTSGRRITIPDRSDAVATPDGRFVTVPSHYTANHTINFYDTAALLARLEAGQPADDVRPVFEHADDDVYDVYYQSVGVISQETTDAGERTVYRMMFSGSRHDPAPGFRIVDYAFSTVGNDLTVTPTPSMALCPQVVKDLNTPFVSKDGRYVVTHDDSDPDRRASLKIFEITGVDPDNQTTSCVERVDFGFPAGKADFSFDNSSLTFHVAKNDYLEAFIDGGLETPVITDVAVVELATDEDGTITGFGKVARITTSIHEGVGNYFPAFFPDGRIMYVSNATPKEREAAKRFSFTVVDPSREVFASNLLADAERRALAGVIGTAWRSACAPALSDFQRDEAAWAFMSLSADQCRALVEDRWSEDMPPKRALLDVCERGPAGGQ